MNIQDLINKEYGAFNEREIYAALLTMQTKMHGLNGFETENSIGYNSRPTMR